jgi:hypothetical protein
MTTDLSCADAASEHNSNSNKVTIFFFMLPFFHSFHVCGPTLLPTESGELPFTGLATFPIHSSIHDRPDLVFG